MKHDMLIGINIHHSGYTPYKTTLDDNLDAAQAMGMNIIRYNNSSNTPEALAEIRRVADGCHARGMKLMLCMDHGFWRRKNGEPAGRDRGVLRDLYGENRRSTG